VCSKARRCYTGPSAPSLGIRKTKAEACRQYSPCAGSGPGTDADEPYAAEGCALLFVRRFTPDQGERPRDSLGCGVSLTRGFCSAESCRIGVIDQGRGTYLVRRSGVADVWLPCRPCEPSSIRPPFALLQSPAQPRIRHGHVERQRRMRRFPYARVFILSDRVGWIRRFPCRSGPQVHSRAHRLLCRHDDARLIGVLAAGDCRINRDHHPFQLGRMGPPMRAKPICDTTLLRRVRPGLL
jgi:hypothetical protein